MKSVGVFCIILDEINVRSDGYDMSTCRFLFLGEMIDGTETKRNALLHV